MAHQPSERNVKNTYPQAKSASKTRTFSQKVRSKRVMNVCYSARRQRSTTPRPPRGKLKENPAEGLSGKNVYPSSKSASKTRAHRQKVCLETSRTRTLRQSAEGGRRRDKPGKEKVKLKHCIALVVNEFARASLRARRALGRLAGASFRFFIAL